MLAMIPNLNTCMHMSLHLHVWLRVQLCMRLLGPQCLAHCVYKLWYFGFQLCICSTKAVCHPANQVSISSTFYAHIFRTKKLQSQNVSRKKTFVQKKASKMLMKLTLGKSSDWTEQLEEEGEDQRAKNHVWIFKLEEGQPKVCDASSMKTCYLLINKLFRFTSIIIVKVVEVQSNSVITNSLRPTRFVHYNWGLL